MEVSDLFEALTFEPPRSFPQMLGWYEISKSNNFDIDMFGVFQTLGVSFEKIQKFKERLRINSFSNKDRNEAMTFKTLKTTETLAILSFLKG